MPEIGIENGLEIAMNVSPMTPQLVSLRSLAGSPGELYDWHEHPFYEFTLICDGHTKIAYPPGWRKAAPNTLFFYKSGERHGAQVPPGQKPLFCVIHLEIPPETLELLEVLNADDPTKRVWKLTADQMESFRWIFFQLMKERNVNQVHQKEATSAWLQILLLNVHRWALRRNGPEISTTVKASPEVRQLWQAIYDTVTNPNESPSEISSFPNYDSVRHAFRRTFGCSPREMLLRLRMEQARNLLVESNLSIKEISERIGYNRQHEFYRAFRRRVGCSPSEWRANPVGQRG